MTADAGETGTTGARQVVALCLVAALVPFAWHPSSATPFAFALVGLAWVVGGFKCGEVPVLGEYRTPLLLLLISLPLILMPRATGINGQPSEIAESRVLPVSGAPAAFEPVGHGFGERGTIALWVRPERWNGDDGRHHVFVADPRSDVLYKWRSNQLVLRLPGAGVVLAAAIDRKNFRTDTWHHVAAIWDSGASPVDGGITAALWLDGSFLATRTQPFSPSKWRSVGIGANFGRSGKVDGQVAGVGFWSLPLSGAELDVLWSQGPNGRSVPRPRELQLFYPAAYLDLGLRPTEATTRRPDGPQSAADAAVRQPGIQCEAPSESRSGEPVWTCTATIGPLMPGAWYLVSAEGADNDVVLTVDDDPRGPAAVLGRERGAQGIILEASRQSHDATWRGAGQTELPPVQGLEVTRLTEVPAMRDLDTKGTPYSTGQGTGVPRLYNLILGVMLLVTVLRMRQFGIDAVSVLAGFTVLIGVVALPFVDWEATGDKIVAVRTLMSRLSVAPSSWCSPACPVNGVNPNEVAGAVAPFVPVLAGVSLARAGRGRYFATIGTIVAIGTVILLQSRGALLGLIVGIGVLGALRARKPWLTLGIGVVLVATTLLWWHLLATGRTGVEDKVESLGGRLEIWQVALEMFWDHPYTGVGLGQFPSVYRTYHAVLMDTPDVRMPHAHNLVLHSFSELGLLGGVAFLGLFVAGAHRAWRAAAHTDSEDRWVGAGVFCGFLVFFVYGTMDMIAPGARGGLFVWALLAAAGAVGSSRQAEPSGARLGRCGAGSQPGPFP